MQQQGVKKKMFKKLLHIWAYSDSEPTEITLGLCNAFLTPIALYCEVGFMPIFLPLVVAAGWFQLWAVSTAKICLRVKASLLSLCLFVGTLILYALSPCGLHDATHYGWLILVLSASGSLIRLKREQFHKS